LLRSMIDDERITDLLDIDNVASASAVLLCRPFDAALWAYAAAVVRAQSVGCRAGWFYAFADARVVQHARLLNPAEEACSRALERDNRIFEQIKFMDGSDGGDLRVKVEADASEGAGSDGDEKQGTFDSAYARMRLL
jgi:hypothetical protein